jgi:hypothetical protein
MRPFEKCGRHSGDHEGCYEVLGADMNRVAVALLLTASLLASGTAIAQSPVTPTPPGSDCGQETKALSSQIQADAANISCARADDIVHAYDRLIDLFTGGGLIAGWVPPTSNQCHNPTMSSADAVAAFVKSRDAALDIEDGACHGAPHNPTPEGYTNCYTAALRVYGPFSIAAAKYVDALRNNDKAAECVTLNQMVNGQISLMSFSSRPGCLETTLASTPDWMKNRQNELDTMKHLAATACQK